MNTLRRDYYQNIILNGLKPVAIAAAVLALPVGAIVYASHVAHSINAQLGSFLAAVFS
ncbi:MAG TPA: hypothetical protein VN665_02080 [Candidatus Paceibacterota bacterium]|nr:hypothetical protein [Candidatus Paceibacterota bacterium]